MDYSLINKILENKQSVREIIDEAVLAEAEVETAQENTQEEPANENEFPEDENEYRHLFVRRWHEGDEKPYKRSKVNSAPEAINLFFDWLKKYKQDKVEIWSDVGPDAKNFYRFCLKNREMIEDLWKQSLRIKQAKKMWTAAFRDIQAKSRQSGANIVGTLYPFEQE